MDSEQVEYGVMKTLIEIILAVLYNLFINPFVKLIQILTGTKR
jgi:hypothetical protein